MNALDAAKRYKYKKYVIAIGAICVACVVAMLLWYYLDYQRNINLQNILVGKTHEFSSDIQADLDSTVTALTRQAMRWEQSKGMSESEFLQDAMSYVRDFPGLQAIEWVDNTFHVRRVVPLKGNEKVMNLNLAFEEKQRLALEAARDRKIPTMTAAIDLVQGGKGFLIYVPLYIDDEFDGFILAVFKIDLWIDSVFRFRSIVDESAEYMVSIALEGDVVYLSKKFESSINIDWLSVNDVHVLGKVFTVSVLPTKKFFENKSTSVPELVALFGFCMSFMLVLMVYVLQEARTAVASMRETNKQLEASVIERKRAENEAKNANQVKTQFLSSMSHELRTPLNAIIGFSQLIDMGGEGELVKKNSREIYKAGKHLLVLVDDILDLGKIESGKLSLQVDNNNLNELMIDCLSIIGPVADKSGVEIDNKVTKLYESVVSVDANRFKQVVLNLLSNAVKYNSVDGRVTITYSSDNEGFIKVSIIDVGKGMLPHEVDRLFRPFERIDAGFTSIEGAGLGLVISKELIELMGGSLGVESEVGKGSRFWINVPLATSGRG